MTLELDTLGDKVEPTGERTMKTKEQIKQKIDVLRTRALELTELRDEKVIPSRVDVANVEALLAAQETLYWVTGDRPAEHPAVLVQILNPKGEVKDGPEEE